MNYKELLKWAQYYMPGYEVYDLALSMISKYDVDSEEAIAGIFMLLFCWNKGYYQEKPFSYADEHISRFREVIRSEKKYILPLRNERIEKVDLNKTIEELGVTIRESIYHLFSALKFLGSTGVSKALHLLLPHLMVMWDSRIREFYRIGSSVNDFLEFQVKMKRELEEAIASYMEEFKVSEDEAILKILRMKYGDNLRPLTKLVDEYNWVIASRRTAR